MSYDTIKLGNARRAREWLSNEHHCAVPGCDKMISRRMLMCATHWHQVPKPIQNAVWNYWKNGPMASYLQARKAAIESVTKGAQS